MSYHGLTVTIYPKFWDDLTTDEERSFMLLHEMCHAITAKQRALTFDALNEKLVRSSEVKDANEKATDWIAKVVWNLTEQAAIQVPSSSAD